MAVLKAVGICMAIGLLSTIGFYWLGRWDGSSKCELRHIHAQLNQDKKVKKAYAKIDRETPFTGSDADIASFLLAHTGH